MVHLPALQGQQERQSVVPDIHPKLQAALDRDGVTLGKLAQVVGLDARTVARWGSEDEYGSRAAAFRRLEDVIAGRARVVDTELGAAVLEELGEGVPRAAVTLALDIVEDAALELRRQIEQARDVMSRYTELPAPVAEASSKDEKSKTGDLQLEGPKGSVPGMNASVLKDVASTIRSRHKGQMVYFAQRVQPDFQARLEEAARLWGMKPSDVLRALVECQLPPPEKS